MQDRKSEKPLIGLTIAGFDPSSGAGMTADLQTFAAHGIFGTSAITALTVQSTRGVRGLEPVRPELLVTILDELEADLPSAGIKIGMLARSPLAEVVATYVQQVRNARPCIPIVLDPVLRSSSGRALLSDSGVATLRERLLPHVTAVTPNWDELAVLSDQPVKDLASARTAAETLQQAFPALAVVATGGEAETPIDCVLLPDRSWLEFAGEHVATDATHGTGCAFSTAMLCSLMQGSPLDEAVRAAKAFVTGALQHAPGLGSGKGPMNLLWPLKSSGQE